MAHSSYIKLVRQHPWMLAATAALLTVLCALTVLSAVWVDAALAVITKVRGGWLILRSPSHARDVHSPQVQPKALRLSSMQPCGCASRARHMATHCMAQVRNHAGHS